MGTFGCFEVTIGWYGKERVDYITCDTKGVWRCYEIKSSLADFNNTNACITFVGNFNYYVMPQELYNIVKDKIPSHVGVYTESNYCVKKAKKQELKIDEQILKDSMIRSLSREVDKQIKSENPSTVDSLQRQLRRAKTDLNHYQKRCSELSMKLWRLEKGDKINEE